MVRSIFPVIVEASAKVLPRKVLKASFVIQQTSCFQRAFFRVKQASGSCQRPAALIEEKGVTDPITSDAEMLIWQKNEGGRKIGSEIFYPKPFYQ